MELSNIASTTEPTNEEAKEEAKDVSKVEAIESIIEYEKYQNGTEIMYVELMGRIETLENRVNRLINAIDKSKKVKGI